MATREAPPAVAPDVGESTVDGHEALGARVLALVEQAVNPLSAADRSKAVAAIEAILPSILVLPAESAALVLRELLEVPGLKEVTDSNGNPLRRAVVGSLLSLGFPAALEVDPADLADLEASEPWAIAFERPQRVALFTAGLLTYAWNMALATIANPPRDVYGLMFLGIFAVCMGHGVAAMVASMRTSLSKSRGLLRAVGWFGFWGPLAGAVATQFDGERPWLKALIGTAPTMLTAGLAAWLSFWVGQVGRPIRARPRPPTSVDGG